MSNQRLSDTARRLSRLATWREKETGAVVRLVFKNAENDSVGFLAEGDPVNETIWMPADEFFAAFERVKPQRLK